MYVKPGVNCQLVAYLSGFAGGVVVHQQVQLGIRVGAVDLAQKAQEIAAMVFRLHRPGDLAGGDLQCGLDGC